MGSLLRQKSLLIVIGLLLVLSVVVVVLKLPNQQTEAVAETKKTFSMGQPRKPLDTSGFTILIDTFQPWNGSQLDDISRNYDRLGFKFVDRMNLLRQQPGVTAGQDVEMKILRTMGYTYEGEARRAYNDLVAIREQVEVDSVLAHEWLASVVFFQGVVGLRLGEDENCILCRGESSCIFPIAKSARHTKPDGARLAIKHFSEYLECFPNDYGVRWLLNLAHMLVGEYPQAVNPRFLLDFQRFFKSEFDIGKFRDIGHLTGVNQFNQAGGAIMDDFDGDGLLDLVVTSVDATQKMSFLHNNGDGTFSERNKEAGLSEQLGGLYCVQADYNNDGHLDIFIVRGAWVSQPMRPSLLRNNGNGTFTDVTQEAGLAEPINSITASWADFDNDGHVDLFVACEKQRNRLFRNKGDGTFEDIAEEAGVAGQKSKFNKGVAWLDFDNDGWPDLFINRLASKPLLFRNNRNNTFTDVTEQMGIDGPEKGFSCWAWDYDNDGFLDIFATDYSRSSDDLVRGLLGQPTTQSMTRLFRNVGGKKFENVSKTVGLDQAYATMGSNFADFDNDGYLDFYLATGDPSFDTLVPNRMFKNVDGKRFAEITASSGTGHLQKGHAVACGDWDRDGNIDLFVQTGGASNGDKYHNVLFQNPGHENHWITLKLVGKKTNRSAIGARIKIFTDGEQPLTVQRHITSGSSFGANPLQQTIGLGRANRIATLEITWPTSGTTQTFKDVPVDQALEITEFAPDFRPLNWKRITVPK